MKATHWILVGLASAVAAQAAGQVTLMHVHGLAYSPDGKRLMIPSHHGLAAYEGGKWSKASGPQHDYMGFSATGKGLYSSGLLRSRDGGKTWEKLGLEGESDFHLLATGWNTNAVYVWNPAPSSRMKQPGLHYTLDDGAAWKPARSSGLGGEPRALAVHPDNAAIVAIATSSGIFLSRDSGERFVLLAGGVEGLCAYFDLDGKYLWYGTFDGQARLARAPLNGRTSSPVDLPSLERDAVAYIAQNPAAQSEYAIATFARSVYLSTDGARTWKRIAEHGRTGN
jgi:photosystem II stability/assembly factor-like uncharacterized protein